MSQKSDLAVSLFNQGFNCAQSVLAVFCEKYGSDPKAAMRLAGGFGSGLRFGEVCGAASGGVMVVGLKHGQTTAKDMTQKAECNSKTARYMNAFCERHGKLTCRELLDSRPTNPADGLHFHKTYCSGLIRAAVEYLEAEGY